MTGKKSFVDEVRDHAAGDDPPHAHRASERRRWADVTKHFRPASVVPPMLVPRPDSAPESCARRRR